ncbi:MAG: tetratricopeptide repeat protein [Deltaproteobacteria bacterium]|nr:MAG: tetratricopeptide repeat protein [Deltaproteobacteria bacterium]
MSLISDALQRVADQRAGRKQPPVVPRRLSGQRVQNKKRLLMILGLTVLLGGVVIGVVFYGMLQKKAGQKEAEEAPTSTPQQVIFDKIQPPAEPAKSEGNEELQQVQELKEDERTPVKPKVVQVAIEQEPAPPDEEVEEWSQSVDMDKGEKPIQTAAVEPGGSTAELEEQPLQPSSKAKVGVVSLQSAEQAKGEQEPLRTYKTRQYKPSRVEKSKPEHLAAPDSTGQARTIVINGGKQQKSVRSKQSGQVNLYAETTAGAASLYRKAVGYQKAMKWQKAIETYNELLRFEPMSAEVYNNIGVCYEKQGQVKMAAKSYEKAISIDPRFYPSYNNLGIIYYRLKNFDKARAAYEQALQLNPGNSQSEVNLALVYERLRRGELARRTLERVLTNDPENAEAHYNLARMLEEQGQHENALTHYRQFLAANPSAYPQLRLKVQDRVRILEDASNK